MLRFLLFLLLSAGTLLAAPVPFSKDVLAEIDRAILGAIDHKQIPGCVIWLEHQGEVYKKAYGSRALLPAPEAMTEDTRFDAASLTKVIATTSAIMKLEEGGKLAFDKPVSDYLPAFAGSGKENVTVRQLLTHTSALRPGMAVPPGTTSTGVLELIGREKLQSTPGSQVRYSDINFILLGLLVEKVSGESLATFCQREIFGPLGMNQTGFLPQEPGITAPTTIQPDGSVLRGVVHDPTSRAMGGVAGHAGLFLTAGDLAKFARMMLGEGELEGVRVLSRETVRRMVSVQTPPGLLRRGFGWEIDSSLRGERFPIGGYGHTGWTGTSLWIDPASESFLIILANRNHPTEDGRISVLRREVATLAARAINLQTLPGNSLSPVLTGIDVLEEEKFESLKGLKIGLITNATGMDRNRVSTIDILHAAPNLKLVSLFSPEHGIRADLDRDGIADTTDPKTKLPINSLYGKNRTPTADQLRGIDALVFDIQDIGCRFYTYISTMANCMEAAAKAKVKFIVLDRPNPIGPLVEGPSLSQERSFIAAHDIPVRHGMTVGELAQLINSERKFGADLKIIRCGTDGFPGWFDRSGLPWQNPSPNMRTLAAATLYPGIGLLEFCKVSVGRGTDTPFELLGAPYIDESALITQLNHLGLPGVTFTPIRFTPTSSVFANTECRGVRFLVTDREAFRPIDLGAGLASILHRLHGAKFDVEKMITLVGNQETLNGVRNGMPLVDLKALWQSGITGFEKRRAPFLLYPR